MKGEWVAAERAEEVRAAARGWRRAGAVSENTFEEISRRYPEPRALPAPLWRLVTAFFVTAVLLLLTGALLIALHPRTRSASVLMCVFAAACVVATEFQESSPRLALRGGAGATAFWGVVFFLVGLGLFLLGETLFLREPAFLNILLLASLALWSLAAWRWGSPVWAFLAAVSLFLLLGRAPAGRLLWIVSGVALTFLFERVLDRPSWAPSHRRCAAVLVVAGVLGVYAAMNLYALDHRVVEFLRETARGLPGPRFRDRVWSMFGTAILPVAILWWGVRSRRTFVLDTGLVLSVLSLLTLRFYVHVAPLWAILSVSGGVLFLVALALNRRLSRGAGGERDGFTAEPLFADEARLRALELVPVVAAHAPEARPPVEPGFQGGGGSFGGGGAGGSF
ncbi:MAG: hypothetical protein NEA02_05550 [Thermoanaerobaculia bacterium]|nr:hypothetical protein [Thermoanaerobaculia bacterium]